jgi:hypothetical protein
MDRHRSVFLQIQLDKSAGVEINQWRP